MGQFRQLLLLSKKHGPYLARGPELLSRGGRRPGKDHQRAGKRVRVGPRQEESTINAASLDWPDVDSRRALLEWLLGSSLQEMGSQWTEWGRPRTMRQHVHWAHIPDSDEGKWLLEWPHVWRAPRLTLWSCLQSTSIAGTSSEMALTK